MLLALDIGNSGISLGVFDLSGDSAVLITHARISSDVHRSSDEYILLLRDVLQLHGVCTDSLTAAAVSSVVPALTSVIAHAAVFFTGHKPLILGPGVRTGLNIRIDHQAQIGTDIVANTVAAVKDYSAPAVIVDFGTVTAISVVDCQSALIGAILCPGIGIALDAMTSSASLLNGCELTRPDVLIGKNTHDSVSSGIINGQILMIDGFIREIRQTLCTGTDEKLSLIATGGHAQTIIPWCRNKFTLVPTLTLSGIAEIYRRNQ